MLKLIKKNSNKIAGITELKQLISNYTINFNI